MLALGCILTADSVVHHIRLRFTEIFAVSRLLMADFAVHHVLLRCIAMLVVTHLLSASFVAHYFRLWFVVTLAVDCILTPDFDVDSKKCVARRHSNNTFCCASFLFVLWCSLSRVFLPQILLCFIFVQHYPIHFFLSFCFSC